MEYTKDVILYVNYGQDIKTGRKGFRLLNKLTEAVSKHKVFTTVLSITIMLIILDFMLITSFVQVLSSM